MSSPGRQAGPISRILQPIRARLILAAVLAGTGSMLTLVPLALRGVKFRADAASEVLKRNLLIYGLGGLAAPFVGIKLIDILVTAMGVK